MKKQFAMVLSALLLAVSVAGCAQSPAPAGAEEQSTPPAAQQGDAGAQVSDISLVFAQQHVTDEITHDLTQALLAQYTADTGVEVKMEAVPEADYRTWLTTQFTAGTGPDVYTGILYDATSDYNKGWIYDFAQLYETESKYDPGKPWKETLPESILERMYVTPQKEVPGYPTSTSVVRIFCNMALFQKAGAKVPTTWAEFIETCQQLKESGTVPFAFPNATIQDLSWLWFNNSVSGQLNSGLVEQLDETKNGFVELNEFAKGVDKGLLNFADPNLKAGYELMKDFSQYWTSDYNSLDRTAAIEMFIRGEAAMVQALSGDLRMLDEMVEFDYQVIPVPVITADTAPSALGKSVVLGGQPDIIYSIGAGLQEAHLQQAIDFVQYMSSPTTQVKYAVDASRIPLATSVQLPDKLSGFLITEEPLRMPYYTGVNEQIRNYFHRSGQQYLEGSITIDQLAEILNQSYKEVFDGLMVENQWTADNNYQIS